MLPALLHKLGQQCRQEAVRGGTAAAGQQAQHVRSRPLAGGHSGSRRLLRLPVRRQRATSLDEQPPQGCGQDLCGPALGCFRWHRRRWCCRQGRFLVLAVRNDF